MAYCTQCGGPLEQGDNYCPACGARIKSEAAPDAPPVQPTQATPPPPPLPGQAPPGLECQGVGMRLAAQLIDSAVILVFYLVLGWMVASRVGGLTNEGFDIKGGPALAVIGLTTIFWLAYFTLLEGLWQGQTLGKKLLGMRVVRQEDGGPLGLGGALARNLLRLVDCQFCYLVAAVLIWSSPLRQRLGDRVAHSLVVKKKR